MSSSMLGSSDNLANATSCAACGEGNIQRHQCKICKTWLYCSKGCVKKGSKKHKKMCSKFALAEQSSKWDHLSQDELQIFLSHKVSRVKMVEEEGGIERQAGNGATAVLDTAMKHVASAAVVAAAALEAATAAAEAAVNRTAAEANVKAARASAEASLREARCKASEAERYGDPLYWEERYAIGRPGGETHEWYVDYPSTAFRQAFPSSVRDKNFLVLGCGNSELSEKMCLDGFRDVLSIDVSESAVALMSERAPRFNSSETKCRYRVMDATQLAFGAGTFGGVVDKGTLDATLSGDKETARHICAEAMRVLEPGGKFLVVSSSGREVLLDPLLDMCGPGSKCDWPLAVSSGPEVYAYAVCKGKGEGVPRVGEALDDSHKARPPPGRLLLSPRARSKAAAAQQSLAVDPDDARRGVAVVGQAHRSGAESRETATATASPISVCSGTGARVEKKAPSASDAVSIRSGGLGRGIGSGLWSGRAPAAGGDLEGGAGEECPATFKAPLPHRDALAEEVRYGGDTMKNPSSSPGGGGGGGGAMPLPLHTSVNNEYTREEGLRSLEHLLREQQQGNHPDNRRKVDEILAKLRATTKYRKQKAGACETEAGSASPSPLPWGVAALNYNEDAIFANFDLDLHSEIRKPELSVEIKSTRVKVCRGPSGAREVLLDRELASKVDVAESTWFIQDKTVLSVSLCKKVAGKWGGIFKNDASSPVALSETKGKEEVASSGSTREKGLLPTAPTCGPVASPPALPRTHKASPKRAIMTCRNFVAPERFLVEDQVGIKTLQLHMSKPPGLKVAECKVSRVGPEVCEVRLLCLDEAAGSDGGPDVVLLQHAELGRKSFNPDQATLVDDAASGVCVVRVPYSDGSLTGEVGYVELGVGSGPGNDGDDDADDADADDENVSRVARIRCRFCDHPFTPPGKGLSVRALPSGRWDECIEDMICFDGPSAVPMLARDVSYAHAGRCLMNTAAVLVHPRDVIPGSVALADDDDDDDGGGGGGGGPERSGTADAGVVEGANDEDSLEGRSLKCARCDLPLGRLAPYLEGQTGEGRGLMLLKHCLLGDNVSSRAEDARDVDDDGRCSSSPGVDKRNEQQEGEEGTVSGGEGGRRQQRCGRALVAPVFEGRTAIKWLMAEMEHSKHADNCSRFTLAARGRSWAAPGGCLSLMLIALHTRVSEHGSRKPHKAHRVAFREQSRDEAETADAANTEEGGGTTPESKEGAKGERERVPARLLELSCGEYRAVRRRLVEAAWASTWAVGDAFTSSDSRGYSLSYLF